MATTIPDMDASTARTQNIRLWVAEEGGPAEFARKHGITADGQVRWPPAQVSQWISDTSPKGIGHKLARSLESALNKPAGSMDRPAESHAMGLDLATLRAATEFLEAMFAARNKVFIASQRTNMLAAVYDDLSRTSTPNIVALSVKYGKQLDGEADERERQAGSAGENDRSGDRKSTRKAKAAAGRS